VSRRNAIPAELRELDQWVGWRWERRVGDPKPTKPPYTADGSRKAKCNDPTTWAPFEVVCAGVDAGKLDGVGFQVKESDPYVGVDLDHCRDSESGAITPSAQAIVDRYASYSEVSPSGTGIRIFIKAVKPGPRCREGNVEIYNRDRFFTVTGRHLVGSPLTIEDRQAELDAHYAELFPVAPPSALNGAVRGPDTLTAYEIIEHARQASNAAHWDQLMRGDLAEYSGDESRADAALCALAAFYTRDPSTIDQIVRMSGLCRPKWTDRADYRDRTIAGALQLVDTAYQAGGQAPAQRRDTHTPATADSAANAGTAALPLTFVVRTPDEMATETPPEPLAGKWLPVGGFGAIYGSPGAGKSLLVTDLNLSLASGIPWLGIPVIGKVPALYVLGEGRLSPRLEAWHVGHPEADWSLFRCHDGFKFSDPAQVDALLDYIKHAEPALVTFDTLATTIGGDENSSQDMGRVIDACLEIQRVTAYQTGVLLVCHPGKDGAKGIRGHSSLEGSLEVIARVTGVPSTIDASEIGYGCATGGSLELTSRKNKEGARVEALAATLHSGGSRPYLMLAAGTEKLSAGALGMLRSLAEAGGSMGWARWSTSTDLHRVTASNLRAQLVARGYVDHDTERGMAVLTDRGEGAS
jgi:putative DNA primase/helicase